MQADTTLHAPLQSQDTGAAALPDKYWREAYAQRWWHARALAAPQAAGAFAARVKGERTCCDLCGNQPVRRVHPTILH